MTAHHVFCDESHVGCHEYRLQGGIWVPEVGLRDVRAAFRQLREQHPGFTEFKWGHIGGARPHTAYLRLADLFFSSPAARHLWFNCLVVHRDSDASLASGKVGRDLGFYKAYYVLLRHRLWAGTDNHVRLDDRTSPRQVPEAELAQCLNRAARRDMEKPFRVASCRLVRSKDEDLLQLADVLCGVVAWAWNGMASTSQAKHIFHQHVASALGWRTLQGRSTWADEPKFNVWHYQKRK